MERHAMVTQRSKKKQVKTLSKKKEREFWNRVFGKTVCPHCEKDMAEYLSLLWNSHGIYTETWEKIEVGVETDISDNFDHSWLKCPYCKKPIEIYLIKPHTLVIKKG